MRMPAPTASGMRRKERNLAGMNYKTPGNGEEKTGLLSVNP
jgi:hypothetical protein